jgi:hypothetical protein
VAPTKIAQKSKGATKPQNAMLKCTLTTQHVFDLLDVKKKGTAEKRNQRENNSFDSV